MAKLSDESYFIYRDTYNSMREINILTHKKEKEKYPERQEICAKMIAYEQNKFNKLLAALYDNMTKMDKEFVEENL